MLRTGQNRVQKCATGVGVDFDQLGAVGSQVKVIAHEGPDRAWIKTGNLRCPGKRSFFEGSKLRRSLDRLKNPFHCRDFFLGNKDRRA